MPPRALSWAQVQGHRLERQRLRRKAPITELAAVAGAVGGIQAQVMSSAQMGLWTRVEGATPALIEKAIWQDRTLVKSWFMRGTLHLLPAADQPLFCAGRPPRLPSEANRWLKFVGIPQENLDLVVGEIARVLEGRCLTRRQIAAAVQGGPELKRLFETSWAGILGPAARAGLICFGPPRGAETTFVRADQWLGVRPLADVEFARLELARRYLRAQGPSTVDDYAWWTGVQPAAARPIWERLRAELEEVEVEGRRMQVLATDMDAIAAAEPGEAVRLLAGFDTYVLGHRSRSYLYPDEFKRRVSRTAGWISQTVLSGGRVVGTWTHRKRGGEMELTVAPFTRLSAAERRGVTWEAEDLEGHFRLPCRAVYD